MAYINLYKIETDNQNGFKIRISQKMEKCGSKTLKYTDKDGKEQSMKCELYISDGKGDKQVGWSWILSEFGNEPLYVESQKSAVAVIKNGTNLYAITFGHSYFMVDKFCDRNFGFDFARRIDLGEIKTTTLTTPSSKRNKMVNTYIDYNQIEYESGESFAKIKVRLLQEDGFNLFKPGLEIGTSIRFSVADESLERIKKIILYVENVILNRKEINKIPVFTKITNRDKIATLERRLRNRVEENPEVNISELDIIGATEVFNRNDNIFELKYTGKSKSVDVLTTDELRQFCEDYKIDYNKHVLEIDVVSYIDDTAVANRKVKDLIDYTDDEEKCLLSKGIWYKYNDDYLTYLKESIMEIDAMYNPEFDFSSAAYDAYIERVYNTQKAADEFVGKSEQEIKSQLRRRYYAERVFNILREENGFTNYDREFTKIDGNTVEIMDLYKDECVFAVKIGNSSGKLCYAVDQSLNTLKLYKNKKLDEIPEFNRVGIWLVLERDHIEDEEGVPDLSKLNMLMLKNKLDQWKKEVRLLGRTPVIYINYRHQ